MTRLLLLVAALAALSACQDPAGVGLGLIGEDEADPSIETIEATAVDTLRDDRPLIGFADSTAAQSQPRVLVGDVADPVFGDARAIGYLDLTRPANAAEVDPATVRSVRLELVRTYVYGDTTTVLPLALRQVQGRWSPTPAYSSDTTFATGPVLSTTSVSVADSVVTFELPASWIQANAGALVAEDFNEAFEGFAIESTSRPIPGAVFGFRTQSPQTRLRVLTDTDTLLYRGGETFTSVQRTEVAAPSTRFVPAQVGTGRGVRLRFGLSSLGPLPLARAVFRAPVETSLAQEGTFVRPIASRALFYGVTTDGTRQLLGELQVRDGQITTENSVLLTAIQQNLVGTVDFASFELVPGATLGSTVGSLVTPASLDILPVLRPGGAAAARFTLTVVGRS